MVKKKGYSNYLVTLTKTFRYPTFIINKDNILKDVHEKSLEEFSEKEISLDDFDVKFELEENTKSKNLRESTLSHDTLLRKLSRNNIGFLVNQFARSLTEEKFGVLNFDENPGIYRVETEEIYDDNGEEVIDEREEIYLNDDVEEYYESLHIKFEKIVREKFL